jgi:TolA-binding protein
MRWPWFRRVCLMGALLPALAVPVTGQAQVESREGIALQNQIYQLRQDLQVLHGQIGQSGGGGGGPSGDAVAQLLTRVQAMEEQVRQLRGRIDDAQNLIARQNAELSKRIDDLTFQLNLPGKGAALTPVGPSSPAPAPGPPPVREVAPRPALEPPRSPLTPQLAIPAPLPTVIQPPPQPPASFTFNQTPEPMREVPPPRVEIPKPAPPPAPVPAPRVEAPKPPTPTPPPAPTPAPKPPQVADTRPEQPAEPATDPVAAGGRRTPEMALQEGHAALARRDYAAAERAAREVMSNRTSPRAYDGQMLLAESLSGEKQFAQAAIAFDDTYNRSHKGRHAQDALLGLAGALSAINEKKAACDTLGRLRTEFPQVRADLQESITKTNERAGCGR